MPKTTYHISLKGYATITKDKTQINTLNYSTHEISLELPIKEHTTRHYKLSA